MLERLTLLLAAFLFLDKCYPYLQHGTYVTSFKRRCHPQSPLQMAKKMTLEEKAKRAADKKVEEKLKLRQTMEQYQRGYCFKDEFGEYEVPIIKESMW